MKTLRVGIIGFGGRGGHVCQTATRSTGGLMQTVAAVDPSDARFEGGCARFGVRPRRYATPEEMLEKENLDLVMIGSPNEFHLENLLPLDGKDIPIMIEKPLDSTWEKICDVLRFSRRHPAPMMVGHCMRYAPILRKAKELIANGAIGRVTSAHFVQYCHYGNGMFHNWRREKHRSGTMIIEKATHDLDVMQWLLDARPTSVFASTKLQAFGGDKPADLRCRDCKERLSCPESIANIAIRWNGQYRIEELKHCDDLCVYSSAVDCPDDEICLIQFDSGVHGTYSQVFYSPRSFHHRDYQITGTLGAMDIDLGAEFGGKITLCPRYGTHSDVAEYKYDYQLRNHYDGDAYMGIHMYEMATRTAPPYSTVDQAFLAEALGQAVIRSAETNMPAKVADMIPADLQDVMQTVTFPV